MRNLKLLMLLLLLVAGISFAGGRSNRIAKERSGNTRKVYDKQNGRMCESEVDGKWYKCD